MSTWCPRPTLRPRFSLLLAPRPLLFPSNWINSAGCIGSLRGKTAIFAILPRTILEFRGRPDRLGP